LVGKKAVENSGRGPLHVAISPDGRYVYYSGPFSATDKYGSKADPDSPPGRVYRLEIGKGAMEPFVTLPLTGEFSGKWGWWASPHISDPMFYDKLHGPVHGLTVDPQGNVLVADQDGQRIAVFDPAAKEIATVKVPYPDYVAVHPKTGALY